jgi:hypothetical protein
MLKSPETPAKLSEKSWNKPKCFVTVCSVKSALPFMSVAKLVIKVYPVIVIWLPK